MPRQRDRDDPVYFGFKPPTEEERARWAEEDRATARDLAQFLALAARTAPGLRVEQPLAHQPRTVRVTGETPVGDVAVFWDAAYDAVPSDVGEWWLDRAASVVAARMLAPRLGLPASATGADVVRWLASRGRPAAEWYEAVRLTADRLRPTVKRA
ncbi:MAG: hypothetical protein NZ518_05415 [Dehalococcoidia bacterium]|nr:hypothetical protein [Dehalococcoidia bacterium]